MVVAVPSGPPLAQDKCELFKLPAELRNNIYELVLAVEPDEHSEVRLRNTTACTGTLIPHPPAPSKPTVLIFLGTCRLLYQEAAGIFYNIHRICLNQEWSTVDRLISNGMQSFGRQRLNCFRALTWECDSVEFATFVCKRVRKMPQLRTLKLRLYIWNSFDMLKDARKNVAWLKRAIKNLDSVTDLSYELQESSVAVTMDPAEKKALRELLDEVMAVLPHEVRKREEAAAALGEAQAGD